MNWNDLPPLFPKSPTLTQPIVQQIREMYKTYLRNGTVLVNFTKSDGTARDMVCTLSPKHIPVKLASANTIISGGQILSAQTQKSNDVCVVFDTDKQAWRSFRWDRLIAITPLNDSK